MTATVQTSKNIASSLWKNLPNSIYLVARYKAIISSLFLIKGNSDKKETILKKNNINVTIRKEFGSKVDAACGQLRANQNIGG